MTPELHQMIISTRAWTELNYSSFTRRGEEREGSSSWTGYWVRGLTDCLTVVLSCPALSSSYQAISVSGALLALRLAAAA